MKIVLIFKQQPVRPSAVCCNYLATITTGGQLIQKYLQRLFTAPVHKKGSEGISEGTVTPLPNFSAHGDGGQLGGLFSF
jgi:hypothetical protein